MQQPAQPAKLLDQVRTACRLRHLSQRTEKAYLAWIRRYITFHRVRHPSEMGAAEVRAFLSHLAVEQHVAASTQNQALSALLLLYDAVLAQPLGDLGAVVRARGLPQGGGPIPHSAKQLLRVCCSVLLCDQPLALVVNKLRVKIYS